jgi:protein TonB
MMRPTIGLMSHAMETWFKPQTHATCAWGLAIGLHACILSIQFVLPHSIQTRVRESFLDVVLVSPTHPSKPSKAHAIAQEEQQGGGQSSGIATTPVPTAHLTQIGGMQEKKAQKTRLLEKEQQLLLSKIHAQLHVLEATMEEESASSPKAQATREEHRQLLNLVGQIEKRIEQNNEKARWHTIGPSTEKRSYAAYYHEARQKIELWGTAHFPAINQQKLYGELIVALTVAMDGQLIDVQVLESSGQATLDAYAKTVVRAAAPFGPFTPDMRETATQLELIARFVFAKDETLRTQWKEQP